MANARAQEAKAGGAAPAKKKHHTPTEKSLANLKPVNTLPKDEQRAIRSAGGKASQEKQRKEKKLRELMNTALSCSVESPAIKAKCEELGLDPESEDVTNGAVLVAAMLLESVNGSAAMAKAVIDLMGESGGKELNVSGGLKIVMDDATSEYAK